jgi:hypothetical protein
MACQTYVLLVTVKHPTNNTYNASEEYEKINNFIHGHKFALDTDTCFLCKNPEHNTPNMIEITWLKQQSSICMYACESPLNKISVLYLTSQIEEYIRNSPLLPKHMLFKLEAVKMNIKK